MDVHRAESHTSVRGRLVAPLTPFGKCHVSVPSDIRRELEKTRGALDAFLELKPTHRRELLRFIDDARTPANRRQRVNETAGHVLGQASKKSRGPNRDPSLDVPEVRPAIRQ